MRPASPNALHRPIISIQVPPPPSGGVPASMIVDANNNITASGKISLPDPGDTLLAVRGRVNGGAVFQIGGGSGINWSITAGPCNTDPYAQPNTFEVQAEYQPNGGGSVKTTAWTARQFKARPQGSHRMRIAIGTATAPSFGVMPRYYRVQLRSLGNGYGLLGMYCGGLLQAAPVLLAFDVQASSDREYVYRALNLPEAIGDWQLRVRSEGLGLHAALSFTRTTERQVLPRGVFECASFNPRGSNRLALRSSIDREVDPWLGQARLEVRPA